MKAKIIPFLKHNFNSILLSLYLGTVINIQIFTLIPSDFFISLTTKIGLAVISLTVFVLSYFISIFAIKQISKINLKPQSSVHTKKHYKTMLLFFIIALTVTLTWFTAYSPGGFSSDSISQYEQALSNNYSDWHPVIHTLLFFKIPMLLFNNSAPAIIICQIILFCIAISYTLTAIHEIAGRKWSIISAIIILANPIVLDELMSPWKDVGFGIFALFITTATLKIYISNGKWGNSNLKIIILAILLGFTTILRHNAILFTIPLVFSLFFFLKHSQWLKLLAIAIITIFLIKIPLYTTLQVSSPGSRVSETTGLPLTIIGSAIKTTPGLLDEELTSFAYNIASQDDWNTKFDIGDFNSIKWQSNLTPIEEAGIFKTFGLAVKATAQSPVASLNGLFKATQVVYNLETTDIAYSVEPYLSDNEYDINSSNNQSIKSLVILYRKFFNNSILHYLTLVGVTIIIMLVFILGHNHWKNGGWKKILLCSPILFYDFGTMLFLTSPETRFFYVNFLVYPIIVILSSIAIHDNRKNIIAKP